MGGMDKSIAPSIGMRTISAGARIAERIRPGQKREPVLAPSTAARCCST